MGGYGQWSCYFSVVLRFLYINSLIHSGYFYSASSSPPLLGGASDTARIMCRSFTPKRHRQLRVKDLVKVPTWLLERDSNPRPFRRNATNLPMSHHAHINFYLGIEILWCHYHHRSGNSSLQVEHCFIRLDKALITTNGRIVLDE